MFNCFEEELMEDFKDCKEFCKNHMAEYSNKSSGNDKGSYHIGASQQAASSSTNSPHESTFGKFRRWEEIPKNQSIRKFIEEGSQKVCDMMYDQNHMQSIEAEMNGKRVVIVGPGLFCLEDLYTHSKKPREKYECHPSIVNIPKVCLMLAMPMNPMVDVVKVTTNDATAFNRICSMFKRHRLAMYCKDTEAKPLAVYICNSYRYSGETIDVDEASRKLKDAYLGMKGGFTRGVPEMREVRDRYCCIIKFGSNGKSCRAFPKMEYACLCQTFQEYLCCSGKSHHTMYSIYCLHAYLAQLRRRP